MDYETFLSILSVTATSSTFALFLCGLQICSRIRQRGTTEGTGVAPFLLTSISCVCWLGYGVIREDSTVIFVNAVGLAVQSIYLAYYYHKTRLRTRLNKLIAIELVVCFLTTWLIQNENIPMSKKLNVLGVICMLLNIATIASPLLDVGQVIRTKNTESLPFFLCVANMGVSLQWLLYGVLMDDFYMKVPNTIGAILSAVQLSLFIIYPSNYKILSVSSSDVLNKGPDSLL